MAGDVKGFPAGQESGLRKQLSGLAQKHDGLVKELRGIFDSMEKRLARNEEILEAVVEELGAEAVKAAVENKRKAKRAAVEAEQTEQLKLLVEKQILVPVEVVDETSTIVTTETFPDGNVMREQYTMAKVTNPEVRPHLLGKKVGEEFVFQDVTVSVKEIYRFDKERADTVFKEEQEKAEAAQKAQKAAAQAAAEQAGDQDPVPETKDETPAETKE